ncbi:MAG: hypothetical protein JWO35_750 [Candidatus Saccharibacteria bacterium]|nr:hypothetical protein [Candidatus Saccharibacteria bacterium]
MAYANPVEIQVILASVDYPVSRDTLVVAAEDADADESVIAMIQELPDGQYETQTEVKEALDAIDSSDSDSR